MRGKINIERYMGERGEETRPSGAVAAVLNEEQGAEPVDTYKAAKMVASKWLHENHRDVLAMPRGNEVQVERAIAQAVAQVRIGPEQARRLREDLRASILGAGPIQQYLDDRTVTEVMVVGKSVWIEQGGEIRSAVSLPSVATAEALAEDMAQKAGHRFQRARPLLNFTLQDGSRVNLVHPMASPTGTCITIRKPDRSRALNLPDLVEMGALSEEIADDLVRYARGRLNILLAGSTGSGKTTLLRAVANATFRDGSERVIVLEDTEELRLKHPHIVNLVAVQAGDDKNGVEISLRNLFVNALRMRPDRLVIGEVRNEEALDAVEAAKSEHGGLMFTMHLRRPEELGPRMYWISQHMGMGIEKNELVREVHEAVDLVVQLDKLRDGRRRVLRVCEPVGMQMVDLYRWDAESDRHMQVGDLSQARRDWLMDILAGEEA